MSQLNKLYSPVSKHFAISEYEHAGVLATACGCATEFCLLQDEVDKNDTACVFSSTLCPPPWA